MSSEHFEALIVGAGFGGIGAAIQLKRMGIDDFVIIDREDDLGGTWHVNHYPGLAVDVPTTTYSYFFEPNPNWSRMYTPGPEIKQYANGVADKYDVRRHMRFNTVVESARWDEDSRRWQVALAGGDALSVRYLITATGFLSQPKTPDIAGIDAFKGKVIHTTEWEDDFDPSGHRVGIIGTGATAVQLIPKLAAKAADLTVYQRTPIWVAPKLDLKFSDRVKWLFARLPWTQRLVRTITDAIYELMITDLVRFRNPMFRRFHISAMDLCKINQFVAIRDKELRRKLTPDYDLGCKRPTFSNSYFRTFAKPHVHLQADGIDRIEADGIVNADGSKTHIDTLVLATGFDLWDANFPAIEVIGRDGRNLGKWWRDNHFEAYQGVSMPYFPNYLNLAGPFAFLGLNFFNSMEYQMRLMDRLFAEMKRQGADTFEVTEEANAAYRERMTGLMGDSLWILGDCATSRSYYFDPSGEPSLLRPMATSTAIEEASNFPLSDYAIS